MQKQWWRHHGLRESELFTKQVRDDPSHRSMSCLTPTLLVVQIRSKADRTRRIRESLRPERNRFVFNEFCTTLRLLTTWGRVGRGFCPISVKIARRRLLLRQQYQIRPFDGLNPGRSCVDTERGIMNSL